MILTLKIIRVILWIIFAIFGLAGFDGLLDRKKHDANHLSLKESLLYLLLAFTCGFIAFFADNYISYQEVKENPTMNNCRSYLLSNPKSHFYEDVVDLYYLNAKHWKVNDLYEFAICFPNSKLSKHAINLVKKEVDSMYKNAKVKNSINGWREYRASVPEDFYKDSEEILNNLIKRSWNTEDIAWKQASLGDSISGYKIYLEMYPKGAHAESANKRMIDLQVKNYAKESQGNIDEIEKYSTKNTHISTVSIYNSTLYTLTMLYSGPTSKKITVSSLGANSASLTNGYYRIVALFKEKVEGSGHFNTYVFYGEQKLTGGEYKADYEIKTISIFRHGKETEYREYEGYVR